MTQIDTFLTNIPISEEECIGDSLQWINSALITLSGGFTKAQREMAREYLTIATSEGLVKNIGDTINGYLQIGPTSPEFNTEAKLTFGKTGNFQDQTLPSIFCGSTDGIGNDLYLTAQSTNGKVVVKTGPLNTEVVRIATGLVGINASGKTIESALDVYGGASIKADGSGNALFIGKSDSTTTGTNYDRLEFIMSVANQTAYIGTANSGSGNTRALSLRTAGMSRLYIATDGTVGIGTDVPDSQYKLQVSGIVRCTSVSQPSDIRLKENVSTISDSLNKINSIRGIEFDWNTNKQTAAEGRDYGVVAQDVEKVYPFAVKEGSDGYKTVNYSALVPLLIEAIKDLSAEVKALKAAQS